MNDALVDRLDRLPPLRETIARFGLEARRALGQHFLLDLNLTRRIARASGELAGGTIVEVGPGPGGLTRSLLAEGAGNLVAIERDRRCIDALRSLEDAADGRLRLIEANALEVDVASLGPAPVRIVANLPYNVATPLFTGWLTAPAVTGMTLMFQKEVADRITAVPGNKVYGRLSVFANWLSATRLLFRVPARAFTPPPKVDSAVVGIAPYRTLAHPADVRSMEAVTAAAFGQRRKTLRRSLSTLDVSPTELLEATGIDGSRRAETLDIAEFAALARSLNALRASL